MFWVSSDLNSGKKVRVFHFGGGGVFWVSSDLNSGRKEFFIGGGCVLGKVGLGLWEQFQWGGGGVMEPNSRTGVFYRNLVKNFWKPSWLVHHR